MKLTIFFYSKVLSGILFSLVLLFTSCQPVIETADKKDDYPINPVDIRNVKVTDDFWLPIIQRVQEKTIEFALEKCQEEGRFENFLLAGGIVEGKTRGYMPFDDTDVYKIIEGASNSLISNPNAELELLLDSLISIVAVGQEQDGYLTTWRTINPAEPPADWVKVIEGKRWESIEASHELYNAGHLFEAAAVHFKATGKRTFLDIALKNADLIVDTFGPGKIETVPGHQIAETGLVKLYRITGEKKYLEMAKYFLDQRGLHENGRQDFGEYSQDHKPVVQQDEVVGHSVRAVYMYAGMTDIAAIYNDTSYKNAITTLWDNMAGKKTYITGGIGASRHGEAFGENYALPNLTAYSETCAAIGSVYWNHRMFMLTGEKKYYDLLERTLYNGLISGISLDGQKFFYPNALESDGVNTFNQGSCTRKDWFDCSCCPTNLIRFIPSVPGLIYSKQADTLYVNLYVGNDAEVDLNGQKISIKQETQYPWNGSVKLTVEVDRPMDFVLKLRVPGWSRNQVIPGDLYTYSDDQKGDYRASVNGKDISGTIVEGYLQVVQNWQESTEILLDFPMDVRLVKADPKVEDDAGKRALEYGPVVYTLEEVDNEENFDNIFIDGSEDYEVSFQPDLLAGVNTLQVRRETGSGFLAIPYYAWSNRGVGKMKVWIPTRMTD